MLMMSGMRTGFGPRGGVTIGAVYLTGADAGRVSTQRKVHERRHVAQWAALGLTLPPLYFVAERVGPLLGAGDGVSGNVFEIAAGLHDGGYDSHALSHNGWRGLLLRLLDPSPSRVTARPVAEPGRGLWPPVYDLAAARCTIVTPLTFPGPWIGGTPRP
jgi:hypothetical protein